MMIIWHLWFYHGKMEVYHGKNNLNLDKLLVGGDWNMTFIFSLYSIGNFIIPIDFHSFQRGSNHQPDVQANRLVAKGFNDKYDNTWMEKGVSMDS